MLGEECALHTDAKFYESPFHFFALHLPEVTLRVGDRPQALPFALCASQLRASDIFPWGTLRKEPGCVLEGLPGPAEISSWVLSDGPGRAAV